MRMRLLLLLAGLGLASATTQATTVVPIDLNQMTARASTIVRGRVALVQSRWTDDLRRVETVVTLDASIYLKGDLGARFVFRMPGGKIGTLRTVVVGAPVIREGDEIVVFLEAAGPVIPHIVGFNQGVFRVATDARSGRQTVARPVLAGEAARTAPLHSGDVTLTTVPVAAFEARIRSIMTRDSGRRDRAVAIGPVVARVK